MHSATYHLSRLLLGRQGSGNRFSMVHRVVCAALGDPITFCSCVRMNKYPLEKGGPISKNNINCINGIYYNFENKKFENFKD